MFFLINKNIKHECGIYKITNIINGKCYIGRTADFYRRYHQYKYGFNSRKVKYINEHFLNSMIKYGFDSFIFEIIELCSFDETLVKEVNYMKEFKSTDKNYGYNKRSDSLGGVLTSDETRDKISRRLKKEWSEGVRKNHGTKLKKSWENGDRDRSVQSRRMTKSLTKYYYVLDENETTKYFYKDLVNMSLSGVVQKFYKKQCNKVIFKGFVIERFSVDKEETK